MLSLSAAEKATNFYVEPGAVLPKRVVVLPVTLTAGLTVETWSKDKLESLVLECVRQTGAFEVVTVSSDQLRRWTGKSGWRSDEKLPADLLARLVEETGCDAVMFVHLNGFSPYPPLTIGWRMRLVTLADLSTAWAVDDWHRAERPSAGVSGLWPSERKSASDWRGVNSPELLIRNSLHRFLRTLPAPSAKSAKVSGEPADISRRVGANQRKPRLPAKETKYGNQSEPTLGAAAADIRSGSGQELGETRD